MKRTVHLGYVDGLRAVAVLGVVFYHAVVANGATFPDIAYCFSRGVNLFFVISGLCLSFPFLSAWRGDRASGTIDAAGYGAFLARRFSRIAPPYYVALTLFAMLAATPFGLPNAHQVTTFSNAAHQFFADLAFATNMRPLFNGSFWTLGIEARWYLLCPLLIVLYMRSRIVFTMIGAALFSLYTWSPYSIADEGTLPCFMLGIVAADLTIAGHRLQRFAWPAALATLALAVADQSRTSSPDLGNAYWYAASFFLVVAGSHGALTRILAWKPIASIGLASYSIYLVHAPLMESLIEAGCPRLLAPVFGVAAGAMFYRVVERPLASRTVRSRVEGIFATPVRMFASGGRGNQTAAPDDSPHMGARTPTAASIEA